MFFRHVERNYGKVQEVAQILCLSLNEEDIKLADGCGKQHKYYVVTHFEFAFVNHFFLPLIVLVPSKRLKKNVFNIYFFSDKKLFH